MSVPKTHSYTETQKTPLFLVSQQQTYKHIFGQYLHLFAAMNENREAHHLLLSESGFSWRKWAESGSGNRMTSTNLCCFVIMALDLPSEKHVPPYPVSHIFCAKKSVLFHKVWNVPMSSSSFEDFPMPSSFQNNHKNPGGKKKDIVAGHPKKKHRRILVGSASPDLKEGVGERNQQTNREGHLKRINLSAEVEGRGTAQVGTPGPKWP